MAWPTNLQRPRHEMRVLFCAGLHINWVVTTGCGPTWTPARRFYTHTAPHNWAELALTTTFNKMLIDSLGEGVY